MSILLFFIASILCGTAISLKIKPVYQADAKIMVKIGRENIYNPEGTGESTFFVPNKEEQINSEIEILTNQGLFKKVIEAIGVREIYPELYNSEPSFLGVLLSVAENNDEKKAFNQAVLKLKNNSHVERVPQSHVIKIIFKHTDPEMAALVINTWIELFFSARLQIHVSPQSYGFYLKQSDILKDKLEEAKKQQDIFIDQYGIAIEPKEERALLIKQSEKLTLELNKTLGEEAGIESKIYLLRNQLDLAKKDISLNEKIGHSINRINSLLKQRSELEALEKKLLVTNKQKALLQKTTDKIKTIHAELKEQRKIRSLTPQSGLENGHQKLQELLAINEIEFKALKSSKKTQLSMLAKYKEKIKQLSGIEIEYYDHKQKIVSYQKNYRNYLIKLEGSRMSNAMNEEKISNVRLINSAQPPLVPINSKPVLNIILSILIGGIGGLGLAFIREYLDDTLESPEDVEGFLGLPVLTVIPRYKNKKEAAFIFEKR